MLSWLKGGPPAASALDDANMFTSSSNQDLRNRNMTTTPQDEDAFTDTSSEEEEDISGDDVQLPQTPAPMFALKAIRTVVWGTPAPPKPRERPIRKKKRSPRSKRAAAAKEERENKKEELPPIKPVIVEEKKVEQPNIFASTRASRNPKILDPIPFKISPKLNLFDPSSTTKLPPAFEIATPVRPSSPAKGILVTPGTALARKKAVTFHPSIGETTPPPKNNHIRSGLPHEFPGKFPSPWTPRVGAPQHRRSVSIPGPGSPARTLTFEEGPLNLDKGKLDKGKKPERSTASNPTGYYEVGEDSRITDYLDDSDDDKAAQQLQLEVSMHEGNAIIDMEAPRSGSSQFWKERTQKIEDAALEKVDKLKARCKIATGYAKKKDEQCADLAEKMREVIEKNKRLKAEIKRLSAQSGSTAGYSFNGTTSSRATGHSHALEEAMNAIDERDAQIAANMAEKVRMESVIQRHKEKLEAFEEMLDNRENKITELSMSMYTGHDDEDLEEVVNELKKKLRAAKQEVRELALVRQEARALRERVEILEKGFMDATAEKERMERELERSRGDDDETSKSSTKRSQSESRLRQQIEALEKTKRELRAEMREKTLTDAKDRREAERKLKAEISDLKGKVGNGWVKEKLEYELKELKEYATRLERELETTKKENDEFKKKSFNDTPARDDGAREWQMKQRTMLQELRRAKEEASTLRKQKAQVEERLKDAKMETENLKETRMESRTVLPLKSATVTLETKEVESASDDSAVDRSFDRWTKGTTSVADVSSFNPRAKSPKPRAASAFNFNSPPVPALANRQKRLFSAETTQKEDSDILPTLPEFSTFMQTEDNADSLFYTQRRQKESPRAKIVNIAISPPVTVPARKVSGVGKVVPRRTTSGGVSARLRMDPARQAAAEKRLADRKKAKMATESA